MSRLQETMRTVPPITQGTIVVCVVVYALQFFLDINLSQWTLNPARVVRGNQWYRILTSPLLHLNPMHIGMNMMSAYFILNMLEKRLGSIRTLCIVLASMVITGLIHVSGAWLLNFTLGMGWLMRENSVGFSGVLFHLSVLECNLGTHANRSVFGFFEVRATLYPWVLLVVLQVIMPNISFAGHLAGILAGTLQLHGLPITPSESYLRSIDEWAVMRSLTTFPSFVATTSQSIGRNSFTISSANGCQDIQNYMASMREACTIALFGRGHAENANIRLGRAVDPETQINLIQKEDDSELSQIV